MTKINEIENFDFPSKYLEEQRKKERPIVCFALMVAVVLVILMFSFV